MKVISKRLFSTNSKRFWEIEVKDLENNIKKLKDFKFNNKLFLISNVASK